MANLVIQPTSTAQWHALVNEAETASHQHLDEEMQSYLVFLLMRFSHNPSLLAKALGIEFLESLLVEGQYRQTRLQDVGDQCLLVTGLFPGQVQKRLVEEQYFVAIGRSAYSTLASGAMQATAQMFVHLAECFVNLMEVLQAMRSLGSERQLAFCPSNERCEDERSRRLMNEIARRNRGH